MKGKSPGIEAVAFAVRSIVVIDREFGVHNFYARTMYVDLHSIGFGNDCNFRRDNVAIPHPFTVRSWHRQAKSIMCVSQSELLCGSERGYRVKKFFALHVNRRPASR